MANEGRYGHYLDNVVWGATVTANASPMSSYSLDVLKGTLPSARLRFSTGTVTITLTFGSAKTATCFAIPASNLQGAVATLTNGAGLSQAITLPTLPATRIPLTAVVAFASSSSTVWNLVISGNAENVILGGCLWLGAYRSLDRNFRYGWHEVEERNGSIAANEYGTEYAVDYGTQARTVKCDFAASETGVAQLKAWHQDGRFLPSFFWPNPLVNDAYVGRWDANVDIGRNHPRWMPSSLTFRELSKGVAV